jgi:lipoyl(octanoyl) transferase
MDSEQYSFTSKWLGQVPYREGLEIQKNTSQSVRKDPRQAMVLGLEHNSIVTLGIRGNATNDLYSSEEYLAQCGIEIERIRRGGQATLHAPGQLVIYPILPVREWGIGTRELVGAIESATRQVLNQRGVLTISGAKEPGVYTDRGKIGFFGLSIEKGVSSHGLAINVANNLDDFRHIRSCGVSHQPMDSLLCQGVSAEISGVFEDWSRSFHRALLALKSTI